MYNPTLRTTSSRSFNLALALLGVRRFKYIKGRKQGSEAREVEAGEFEEWVFGMDMDIEGVLRVELSS